MEGHNEDDAVLAEAVNQQIPTEAACADCNEGRRMAALQKAIEVFGEEVSVDGADELVTAAKVFEAYLKGE